MAQGRQRADGRAGTLGRGGSDEEIGVQVDVARLGQVLGGSLALDEERAGAATALVIGGDDTDQQVLVIERRARTGDPWSGDMALPGGRSEDGEALADTAIRETREETGVALPPPFARLPDVGVRFLGGKVATFLFRLPDLPEPRADQTEVADAFWLPLRVLFDPSAATRHRAGPWGTFPGILVDHDEDRTTPPRVLWGLTLQMLTHFAEAVGTPLAPDVG